VFLVMAREETSPSSLDIKAAAKTLG